MSSCGRGGMRGEGVRFFPVGRNKLRSRNDFPGVGRHVTIQLQGVFVRLTSCVFPSTSLSLDFPAAVIRLARRYGHAILRDVCIHCGLWYLLQDRGRLLEFHHHPVPMRSGPPFEFAQRRHENLWGTAIYCISRTANVLNIAEELKTFRNSTKNRR